MSPPRIRKKDVLRYELGLLVLTALTSLFIAWSHGFGVALKAFLLFFLTPQPFVIFIFKEVIFSREKDLDSD